MVFSRQGKLGVLMQEKLGLNYADISKETVSFLYKSYESLKNSPLDQSIRILIELRASQINGCAYCCGLHIQEARRIPLDQEKMDLLPAWHNSRAFSEKERAALEWCEALIYLKDVDKAEQNLKDHFSERQIVDLTLVVSIMNALNRLSIAFKS